MKNIFDIISECYQNDFDNIKKDMQYVNEKSNEHENNIKIIVVSNYIQEHNIKYNPNHLKHLENIIDDLYNNINNINILYDIINDYKTKNINPLIRLIKNDMLYLIENDIKLSFFMDNSIIIDLLTVKMFEYIDNVNLIFDYKPL